MDTWTRFFFWMGVLAVAGGFVLERYVLEVWRVPSDDPLLSASVAPTLGPGDVVLVTRAANIARGYLLRCADPQAPGRFVIGRAMARSGERIDIREGEVSIDGTRTPSPRRCEPPNATVRDPQSGEDVTLSCSIEEVSESSYSALRDRDHPEPPVSTTVADGHWYLVSDDRQEHLDSRDFGSIDPATCRHIVYRLVGAAGIGDRDKRFTVIW